MRGGPLALTAVLTSLIVFSCAAPPKKKEEAPPPAAARLPIEEQERKSRERFEEILDLKMAALDRKAVLPVIRSIYEEIITDYPDAYLAQESYWRLIIISLEDHFPPKTEDAVSLYGEFTAKYPESRLRYAVDDTIVRFYYRNGLWKDIEAFCVPYIRRYIKTGTLDNPLFLFFYTEAKFNLGDFIEADKGYRTLIRLYPGSQEATVAGRRLEEMKMKRGNALKNI